MPRSHSPAPTPRCMEVLEMLRLTQASSARLLHGLPCLQRTSGILKSLTRPCHPGLINSLSIDQASRLKSFSISCCVVFPLQDILDLACFITDAQNAPIVFQTLSNRDIQLAIQSRLLLIRARRIFLLSPRPRFDSSGLLSRNHSTGATLDFACAGTNFVVLHGIIIGRSLHGFFTGRVYLP